MKQFSKSVIVLLFPFLLSFLLLACSNESSTPDENSTDDTNQPPNENVSEENGNDDSKEPEEEVTLSIMIGWDEPMFNERFKEPIEKAFPNIKLELVSAHSTREQMEDLFADGINPDIFAGVSHELMEYFEIDYDLDELIEKHNYDFSHMNPVFLDAVRSSDPEGRLLAIPYEIINFVLFYNRDIFDLFGEEYPSNHMTWNEVLELGRRMTGERNGIYYRGIDLANPHVPLMQLAVNLTDPETGEVLLDQPEIAQYFDLLDAILDIQGDSDGPPWDGGRFPEAQTTAMIVEFVQALNWWQDNEALNEAVAPLPVWEDRPPVSHRPDGMYIALSINPASEHKDEAFKVITYFTEDEYQRFASRQGIGPTTKNTEVLNEFFQDYDFADDTNVATIFEHPPASPPEKISVWDQYVHLDPHRYASSGMERNEYLRVIKEEAETRIKEAKATQ